MGIMFTASPFIGQTATYNGKTWVWDGYAWTGLNTSQRLRYANLGYAPSITVNLDQFDFVDIMMNGPVTLNCSGGADGQVLRVRCTQDNDGSRVLTLGNTIKVSSDLPGFTLSTTPGAVDVIAFTRRAAALGYDFVSFVRGFQS